MTAKIPPALVIAIAHRGWWLCWLAAGAALMAASAGWLEESLPPTVVWLLSLFSHWQWVILTAGLLASSASVICGRPVAMLPGALVLGSWFLHLGEAPSPRTALASTEVLRVATINLNYENRDLQPLGRWVAAVDAPDILVLQEFTPAHQQIIDGGHGAEWARAYVFRSLHPQSDQFGIAVLSRWPIRSAKEVAPHTVEDTLKLHLVIDWQQRLLALTAIHPMPPISWGHSVARDRSMLLEARRLAALDMPGILVGDFNDTPWSAGMRALAPYLSRASGLAPTWPNAYGRISLLPLDHALVTRHWSRVDQSVGADVGSDHRPVMTAIALEP
jgi:endonuclease/exonuclease/phosphatase (EEP) superfamily protein YafD